MPSEATDNQAHTLQADVRCIGCDYNLRGLALDGNCPECGKRVAHSLWLPDLAWSQPRWIFKLWIGVWLIWLALTGWIGGAAAASFNDALGLILLLAGCVCFSVSQWLLTEPEAGREARFKITCQAARILAGVYCFATTIVLLASLVAGQPPKEMAIVSVIGATILTGAWAWRFASPQLASTMARNQQLRIGREIESSGKWLAFSVTATFGFGFTSWLLETYVPRMGSCAVIPPFFIAAIVSLFSLLVVLVTLPAAQRGLSRAYREAAQHHEKQSRSDA